MYKKILIPTDGSEVSEKAVQRGVELAKLFQATVVGINVYPSYQFHPDAAYAVSALRTRQEASELAKTQAQTFLERAEKVAQAANVGFEGVALQDDQVWKGIIDTAKEKGCDLIVMAAHGRRGLAALIIGSETNKVLTHSKIPVLVYR